MSESQGRVVAADSVSIQAATVELKVVTVGRKQMTLSVFRQLPDRHVVDPGKGLLGEPWGTVNYFWDGCGYGGGGHLHVLWVAAGQLFRACVGPVRLRQPDDGYTSRKLKATLEAYGDRVALDWLGGDEYINSRLFGAADEAGARDKAAWWNAARDRLAALDQLFIAV